MPQENPCKAIADEISYLLVSVERLDGEVLAGLQTLLLRTGSCLETDSSLVPQQAASKSALERCAALLLLLREDVGTRSLQSPAWADFVAAASALCSLLASSDAPLTAPAQADDEIDDTARTDYLAARHILLPELESEILAISDDDPSSLQGVRRELHTIKGDAGFLGFGAIETACHTAEDWMVEPRSADETIDFLLSLKDWIGAALETLAVDGVPAPLPADFFEASAAPSALVSADPSEVDIAANDPGEAPLAAQIAKQVVVDWDDDTLEVIEEFIQESSDGLTLSDEILLASQDSGIRLDDINALFRTFHSMKGVASFLELEQITTLSHATETLLGLARSEEFEFSGANLNFLFDATSETRHMLDDLRGAVEEGRSPRHRPSVDELTSRLRAAAQGDAVPKVVAKEVVAQGNAVPKVDTQEVCVESVAPAVVIATAASQPATAAPQVAPAPTRKPNVVAAASPVPAAPAKSRSKRIKETVKVDLERVDSLVEMIGELVIVESMVVNEPLISGLGSPKVNNYLSQLGKIARDLQDISMRMRMVPVRAVFQKMSRLVRDLSQKEGKKIRAKLDGEWNEMDRSMVEQLADPLVHMIRNAVDHGLESEEERIAAGKPPEGNISLSAYHQGGSIVIEVSDDGRGLNRDALMAKAVERGIIKSGEVLSDFEVYNLIFAPGFSTAKAVTQISGRGVGMDVVRRNVEALRGRVSISSTPGEGSTFKVILPLTLAIIDGMVIATGTERYIVPTLSIIESVRPTPSILYSYADRGSIMKIRDESIPLIRLDALFEIDDAVLDPTACQVVVLETSTGKLGLIVDEVVAQQQVVIKPLGSGVPDTRFLSGAAILSDGRVGLILNVDELSAMAQDIKLPPAIASACQTAGADASVNADAIVNPITESLMPEFATVATSGGDEVQL